MKKSQREDVLSVWPLLSVMDNFILGIMPRSSLISRLSVVSWKVCLWQGKEGESSLERRKDLSAGSTGFYLPLVEKFNTWV